MKKFSSLFLLLPVSLTLLSCSNSDPRNGVDYNYEERDNLILDLIDNVYVELTATVDVLYPKEYDIYNTHDVVKFERQYSKVLVNNRKTNAARVFKDDEAITYYQETDGTTYYEVLTKNNTVKKEKYLYNKMPAKFANMFANPFNNLDASDLERNLTISNAQASIMIKSFIGLDVNVTDAYFVIEDDKVVGINSTISDKTIGIVLNNRESYLTQKTTVEIKLDSECTPIETLKPNTTKNEKLDNALSSLKDNYTIDVRCMNFTTDARLYVTSDVVYLKTDIESNGPSSSDSLFVKEGQSWYLYEYNLDTLMFENTNEIQNISDVLPSFDVVKSEMYTQTGENQFVLNYQGAKLNASLLVVPEYNLFATEGKKAIINLDNGNIKDITVLIDDGYSTTINQTVSNIGTTVLPSWLDINK